jgi:hypothetical protein
LNRNNICELSYYAFSFFSPVNIVWYPEGVSQCNK